jgi:hypothetical protein
MFALPSPPIVAGLAPEAEERRTLVIHPERRDRVVVEGAAAHIRAAAPDQGHVGNIVIDLRSEWLLHHGNDATPTADVLKHRSEIHCGLRPPKIQW